MAKKQSTRKGARNSKNGQFITMEDAKKRPKTTEVEDIPVGKPKKKS